MPRVCDICGEEVSEDEIFYIIYGKHYCSYCKEKVEDK